MSEQAVLAEDQSHYEISLTAGQAFVAFVLLLLSLAASFAFGLLMGKGQGDDRLVARKDPAVINEANVAPRKVAKTVELSADDFKQPAEAPAPAPAVKIAEAAPKVELSAPVQVPATPAYAQLLSSSDQKVAEALATKVIDAGFNSAYVERSTTDKGTIFRVRVKFASEAEARAAEAKLKTFSRDVWITTK